MLRSITRPSGPLRIVLFVTIAVVGAVAARGAALDVPVAATVVDLERDGAQQLLVGWKAQAGGRLEWRPVVSRSGESGSRFAALPVTPDFLSTGDFDADGKLDVIVAARGDAAVWFLLNDGHGGFGTPARLGLPGRLTAAVAGDVNRLDGLADFVVAVDAGTSASLLVFEDPHGAKNAAAETIPIPVPASELTIAMLDDDGFADVAATCGAEFVVVGGRDRMLGSGRPEAAVSRPVTRTTAVSFPVAMLSAGRFAAGTQLIHAKVSPFPGDDLLVFDPALRSLNVFTADPEARDGVRLVDRLELGADARVVVPVRMGASALEDLLVVGASGTTIVRGRSAVDSLFVVNDPGDTPDASSGDGACDTGTGACTLRAAIQESNASAGVDSIQFALGAGHPIIAPASALPAIAGAVTIDGATGGATRVVLTGASAGAAANGILLGAGSNGSAIRSLVINGFAAAGIRIEGGSNIVEGCYIGTDAAGGVGATGNHDGVVLTGSSANGNTIGGTTPAQRNVISHNSAFGGYVTSAASPNMISGNYIGVGPSGAVAVPNGSTGVHIDETTANAVRVGGSAASPGTGQGNVVVAVSGTSAIWVSFGSSDLIQGNLIGLDATGASALGAGLVSITRGTNATIGGPTVAERNVLRGLEISNDSASAAKIQGNYIGTNIGGDVALGGSGILVSNGPIGVLIGGNTSTFGTPPGNVISGNSTSAGVTVGQGTHQNPCNASVLGNIIGLKATGSAKLPNASGVGAGNSGFITLGGENPGDGNLISGNTGDGVTIPGGTITAKGNWIGPNLAGTAALGNGGYGVLPSYGGAGGSDPQVTIGGTNAGAGNVISGNALDGIRSDYSATTVSVRGNRIGVAPDGVQPMGNGGAGVMLRNFGAQAPIGGTTGLTPGGCTGACNVIAYNALAGISLPLWFGGTTTIRGNSMFGNGGLGIDLDGNGVTQNDPGDGDLGSNRLQNFPVITSRTYDGVNTTIQGTLNSAANTTYALDVFANSAADPSGYGEGEVWLGSTTCATDATQSCSWSFVASGSRDVIAATATSPSGETSELSIAYASAAHLDTDGDGVVDQADNCVSVVNPLQADSDGDGVGNLCDNCVTAANPSLTDGDGDGAGDACDCQPLDSTDRRPREVPGLTVSTGFLFWNYLAEADRYSVTRGDLATLGATQFGACVAEGITTYSDSTVPAPGRGFFYLVAGQNFDCGLGTWGKLSNEQERVNGNPAACAGTPVIDVHAVGEITISGTRTGSLANTQTSDNQYEAITEVLVAGYSYLEHQWTFTVGSGSKELHVEGFRTASTDGDDFRFECSTDGSTWNFPTGWFQPLSDNNYDQPFYLGGVCAPAAYTGNVIIRVVDRGHSPGNQTLDTVTLDEVFVRMVP